MSTNFFLFLVDFLTIFDKLQPRLHIKIKIMLYNESCWSISRCFTPVLRSWVVIHLFNVVLLLFLILCFFFLFRSSSAAPPWSPGFRASARSSLTCVTSSPALPTLTTNWTPSAPLDVMRILWPLRQMLWRASCLVWPTSGQSWRVTPQTAPACSGERAPHLTSWLSGERRRLWAARLARWEGLQDEDDDYLMVVLDCNWFNFPYSPAERARAGQVGPYWGCCWEGSGVLQGGGWAARPAGKGGRGAECTERGWHRGGDDQTAAAGVQGKIIFFLLL